MSTTAALSLQSLKFPESAPLFYPDDNASDESLVTSLGGLNLMSVELVNSVNGYEYTLDEALESYQKRQRCVSTTSTFGGWQWERVPDESEQEYSKRMSFAMSRKSSLANTGSPKGRQSSIVNDMRRSSILRAAEQTLNAQSQSLYKDIKLENKRRTPPSDVMFSNFTWEKSDEMKKVPDIAVPEKKFIDLRQFGVSDSLNAVNENETVFHFQSFNYPSTPSPSTTDRHFILPDFTSQKLAPPSTSPTRKKPAPLDLSNAKAKDNAPASTVASIPAEKASGTESVPSGRKSPEKILISPKKFKHYFQTKFGKHEGKHESAGEQLQERISI